MAVSVIIPTLNEATTIAATIDAARAAGAAEVIVVDGGSSDATIAIVEKLGVRTITGERLRANQINRGIDAASHETIIVVHADTLLPSGATAAVEQTLNDGAVFGAFHVRFIEGGPRLAYVAFMINVRTRLTKKPWGDQAQFARRETLLRMGGYPPFPIMEDYELARRMKRAGRIAFLPLSVQTSGRRFLARGVIRTSCVNWLVIFGYHLGVTPERLARWYRS
ncbi:MAG TPA: TIGR04283 family arsenosugar biosynthesis glycosyltransferase [Thermoanaerobaculia bacterium]|nr:TIGR04283 family arsenosugar biosynthesis glycosyltransferase [Thermoanaerobaculia bacterium]